MRITVNIPEAAELKKLSDRTARKVSRAVKDAVQDVADEMKKKGDADISSAGKFGRRWTEGFEVRASRTQGRSAKTGRFEASVDSIRATHNIPYWTTHQYGATIKGRPLLWIPFSGSDAEGISARDYPGQLFRVPKDRAQMRRKGGGAPLLLSAADGVPKYHGHESVTVPKRFHLVEIIRNTARRINDFFKKRFHG